MADYTPISMIRGSSTIIDSTPIVDGQILFDETRKCLFMDNGSTREKYSGLGADSNIANVEDTTTASQPYTTGEFVVVEGQLYKVTASIATGDTFSVGTNIETDTVGSELTKINADLTELSTLTNIAENPTVTSLYEQTVSFANETGKTITTINLDNYKYITVDNAEPIPTALIKANGIYRKTYNGISYRDGAWDVIAGRVDIGSDGKVVGYFANSRWASSSLLIRIKGIN